MTRTIIVPAGAPMWEVNTGTRLDALVEVWATAEYQPDVERFEFDRAGWRWSVRKQDVRVVAQAQDGRPYGAAEE